MILVKFKAVSPKINNVPIAIKLFKNSTFQYMPRGAFKTPIPHIRCCCK